MNNSYCSYCKDKNCEYRGKTVEGHEIFTTAHCCKLEVEETRTISESKEFTDLMIMLSNTKSRNAEILLNKLQMFRCLGTNKLQ